MALNITIRSRTKTDRTLAIQGVAGTADSRYGEPSMLGAIDQGLRGINDGFDRLNTAARRIANEGANGDLAGNLVDLMRAREDVQANVASVRAADEMIGSLLDVFA